MNRTMDNFKFTSGDIAGLIIFVVAVGARGSLEAFGHGGIDYTWITTFAVVAAAWLSLGSRSRDIHNAALDAKETAAQVEENTNGKLTAKLDEQTKTIIDELKPPGV